MWYGGPSVDHLLIYLILILILVMGSFAILSKESLRARLQPFNIYKSRGGQQKDHHTTYKGRSNLISRGNHGPVSHACNLAAALTLNFSLRLYLNMRTLGEKLAQSLKYLSNYFTQRVDLLGQSFIKLFT